MSLSRQRTLKPVPAIFADEYWQAFRKNVFILLWKGYSRLDHNHWTTAEEESITGELVRHIEDTLDDPEGPDWFCQYTIHEECHVHHPNKLGKHRRRLDIRFQHNQAIPRVHYEFEAKRLCKNKKKDVSGYLGEDGLELFLSGEYGRRWPEAGMIGYVQSNHPGYWAEKLAHRLSSGIIEPWKEQPVIDELLTYKTCHPRVEDLESIRIFHILLSFT